MREKLKSPFRILRNFALSKQGSKEEASPGIGEGFLTDVAKFMQDAEDMRAKFEGFLTNGQIISGAAYDFSTSLKEMASYMMDSFGEIDDEETGNIFSLLAKVQFEMSKLLQLFAAHVSETIIKPTETIITRIQQAAIMKDQYDEKWKEYIVTQMEKQKGKSKRGNGNRANQPSVMAKEGLKEQANALNLYMQSLTQGQSETLVTLAVKYHSAQMHLFSKGLASINAVEPMMRQLALEKIIDRKLSENQDSMNDFLDSMEMDGEGKVSTIDFETDSMASSPRHLLVEEIEPPRYSSESSEEFLPRRASVSSKSAPISPLMHHKREATAKESSHESGHERVSMYALPSPLNRSGRWVENESCTRKPQKHSDVQAYYSGSILEAHILPACNLGSILEAHILPAYHSGSILEAHKPNRIAQGFNDAVNDISLGRQIKDQFVQMQQHQLCESKGTTPRQNPDFFVEDAIDDDSNSLSTEKRRRYSQSGPLIDRAWTSNNSQCANVRKASPTAIPKEHLSPVYKSGPISRSPVCSYTVRDFSPPPSSMPQISELHKLPLPPPGTPTPPKSPSRSPIAYSAPLGKIVQAAPSQAGGGSPLPSLPPSSMTRSLSIPASTTHGPDSKKDL